MQGSWSQSGILAPRQGAGQLLEPALLPGIPDPRQAARTPDPRSISRAGIPSLHPRSSPPTSPTPRSSASWLHSPTQSQGPLQLLLKASRPAARAEAGSSPISSPWGVCDSPHYLRPGAQADSSVDKPSRRGRSILHIFRAAVP